MDREIFELKRAAASGLIWTSLATYCGQFVQIVTWLLLAGLLRPDEFGTFALASVITGWLGLAKGLGLDAALVQNRSAEEQAAANTAFWLVLAQGCVLFLVAWLVAPWAGLFFGDEDITPVVRVLGFSFILFSLTTVNETLLWRRLQFRAKALPNMAQAAVYAVIAVVLAFQGFGVWSIVCGLIVSNFVRLLIFWGVSPFRPSLQFDRTVARELWSFGGIAMANNVAIFLNRIVDRAAVGRLLGVEATGYYDFAFRIGTIPETRITKLFYGIGLPLFSEMQNDLRHMKHVYLTAIRYLALATFPVSLGILTIGPTFLRVAYADKWMPAVPLVSTLALFGLISSIAGPSGLVMYALGKPKLLMRIDLGKLALRLAGLYYAAMQFGTLGVAVLATSLDFIFGCVAVTVSNNLLDIRRSQYLSVLLRPCLGSAFASTMALAFGRVAGSALGESVWTLIAKVGAFVLSYVVALLVLDGKLRQQCVGMVSDARVLLSRVLCNAATRGEQ